MAKKNRQSTAGSTVSTAPTRVESAVVEFAEDLGRLLGTAQAKAEGWMNQRKAIADQLAQIRDTANRYLQQLTGATGTATATRGRRRGRPPGSKSKTSRNAAAAPVRRRRVLSPEARERIAAAQRARWAKQKSARNTK
jgi:hypothetical protein